MEIPLQLKLKKKAHREIAGLQDIIIDMLQFENLPFTKRRP